MTMMPQRDNIDSIMDLERMRWEKFDDALEGRIVSGLDELKKTVCGKGEEIIRKDTRNMQFVGEIYAKNALGKFPMYVAYGCPGGHIVIGMSDIEKVGGERTRGPQGYILRCKNPGCGKELERYSAGFID